MLEVLATSTRESCRLETPSPNGAALPSEAAANGIAVPALPIILPLTSASPPLDKSEPTYQTEERSFHQLVKAVQLYSDKLWREENFPSKKAALAYLHKRFPALRACSLEINDLCQVVQAFPDISDWGRCQFDPQRLLREIQDPQRQQAQREARKAERQACRQVVEKELRVALLLQIRDGQWHPSHTLIPLLEDHLPAELLQRRQILASGAENAKYLFLKDTIRLLKRQRLVVVRTHEDGEEEIKSTPRKDPRFDVDPQFRNELPRAADEVAQLEAQLLADGCRDPLIVWKEQKLLVDGYTRFEFLSLLGHKYDVQEVSFKDRDAVISFIRRLHYGRRNSSAEMKSYIRGKHVLSINVERGGDRSSHSAMGKTFPLTMQALAQEYRLDRRTLHNDRRFTLDLDQVAASCGGEVRDKFLSRAIKWTRGDIKRLAKLKPASMKGIVRAALEANRRPKLPKDEKRKTKVIGFPLGDSRKQARAVERLLTLEELAEFHKAVGRRLKKRRRKSEE